MDTRDFAKARRERTRHLIEIGGLVQKSGLVELVGDDRAVIFGALIEAVERLKGVARGSLETQYRTEVISHWKRKGRGRFDADDDAATKAPKK